MPQNKELKSLPRDEVLRGLGKGEHGEIWAQWNFSESPRYKRTPSWYFWTILIALGLVIWSLATANFLFVIIIILAAMIIFLHHHRPSLSVVLQITQDGLQVGHRFYEWREVNNFRLVYRPPEVKKIYFELKTTLTSHLSVPLEKQNPVKIRKILLKYCQENLAKDDEGFGDFLSRSLKI